MILYDLQCSKGHVFEAWFKDSDTYEAQAARKAVVCPACGGKKVSKAPMAPRVAKSREAAPAAAPKPPAAPPNPEAVKYMQMLGELRQKIEENCDYVGPQFPEEARKIHYGEAEARNIYGEATPEEAETLAEEGIEFGKVPWVPRGDA
ncbi:MAG: DUF1178 family protein [Rhodospirillales bacterium]